MYQNCINTNGMTQTGKTDPISEHRHNCQDIVTR